MGVYDQVIKGSMNLRLSSPWITPSFGRTDPFHYDLPYRLYVSCGKRGCSRQTGLYGKRGCSCPTGLCGKPTDGREPALIVSSRSVLRASALCRTTPAPSRLKVTSPATRATRRGRLRRVAYPLCVSRGW